MKKSFFIDEQGRRFSTENSYHILLADSIIEKNKSLKEEFLKSGKRSTLEFLMKDKMYIAGVEDSESKRKEITYDSKLISESQKKWIKYYRKNRYYLLDLAEVRERSQKGNIGRGED